MNSLLVLEARSLCPSGALEASSSPSCSCWTSSSLRYFGTRRSDRSAELTSIKRQAAAVSARFTVLPEPGLFVRFIFLSSGIYFFCLYDASDIEYATCSGQSCFGLTVRCPSG